MILGVEKAPPPPYMSGPSGSSLSSRRAQRIMLNWLPAHVLLEIVYWTCPQGLSLQERHLSLYWMSSSMRYVCRDLWFGESAFSTFISIWALNFTAACMHILRSSYLPLYIREILPPFSSDPFPTFHPSTSLSDTSTLNHIPIISSQRETLILDRFILIKVRDDVRADESDLYLDHEHEQYRDLFNFMQASTRFLSRLKLAP